MKSENPDETVVVGFAESSMSDLTDEEANKALAGTGYGTTDRYPVVNLELLIKMDESRMFYWGYYFNHRDPKSGEITERVVARSAQSLSLIHI